MRIIFVRHGEPDYEHDCLTETGRKQAAVLRTGGHDHLPPVFPGDDAGLVAGVPGRNDVQTIQPGGFQGAERHLDMPLVNRVKGTVQDSDTLSGQGKSLLQSLTYIINDREAGEKGGKNIKMRKNPLQFM
jgi:hypothetical protein